MVRTAALVGIVFVTHRPQAARSSCTVNGERARNVLSVHAEARPSRAPSEDPNGVCCSPASKVMQNALPAVRRPTRTFASLVHLLCSDLRRTRVSRGDLSQSAAETPRGRWRELISLPGCSSSPLTHMAQLGLSPVSELQASCLLSLRTSTQTQVTREPTGGTRKHCMTHGNVVNGDRPFGPIPKRGTKVCPRSQIEAAPDCPQPLNFSSRAHTLLCRSS
jgi:hypothetical protein